MTSQQAVAQQMGLSWDEVHGIMERAVQRGLARRQAEPLRYLGVDEKSFRKGHRYFTIVNDLDRSRVLYVVKGRKQEDFDTFWQTLTDEQRNGIQAVAMDMWEPYAASVRENLPVAFAESGIGAHMPRGSNNPFGITRRNANGDYVVRSFESISAAISYEFDVLQRQIYVSTSVRLIEVFRRASAMTAMG